jgi:hypothetical protein
MVNGTTESVKIIGCFDNEISSELKKAARHKNEQFIPCHLAILSNTNSDLCYYGLDELKCNFYIFLAGMNRIKKINC